MSLLISLGSNIGDKKNHLIDALKKLENFLGPAIASQMYSSAAVDYTDQDSFINQVLQFSIPQSFTPEEVLEKILYIELSMGRKRNIHRGPRTIDIDLLFWGELSIKTESLSIPHPRWAERSFILLPMGELPFGQKVLEKYENPQSLRGDAKAIPN